MGNLQKSNFEKHTNNATNEIYTNSTNINISQHLSPLPLYQNQQTRLYNILNQLVSNIYHDTIDNIFSFDLEKFSQSFLYSQIEAIGIVCKSINLIVIYPLQHQTQQIKETQSINKTIIVFETFNHCIVSIQKPEINYIKNFIMLIISCRFWKFIYEIDKDKIFNGNLQKIQSVTKQIINCKSLDIQWSYHFTKSSLEILKNTQRLKYLKILFISNDYNSYYQKLKSKPSLNKLKQTIAFLQSINNVELELQLRHFNKVKLKWKNFQNKFNFSVLKQCLENEQTKKSNVKIDKITQCLSSDISELRFKSCFNTIKNIVQSEMFSKKFINLESLILRNSKQTTYDFKQTLNPLKNLKKLGYIITNLEIMNITASDIQIIVKSAPKLKSLILNNQKQAGLCFKYISNLSDLQLLVYQCQVYLNKVCHLQQLRKLKKLKVLGLEGEFTDKSITNLLINLKNLKKYDLKCEYFCDFFSINSDILPKDESLKMQQLIQVTSAKRF